MSLWTLVGRELRHRGTATAIGLAVSAVAAGILAAGMALIDLSDARLQRTLKEHATDIQGRATALQSDIDRSTLKLGFNMIILPKAQQLSDWYADDYAAHGMPEQDIAKLADAKSLSMEHLVPVLRQKATWPETDWTVLVLGIGDAARTAPNTFKSPLPRTRPGAVSIGHEIRRSLRIEPGQKLTFKGITFTVLDCPPERGTKDDITIWMDLADAQAAFDKRGLINEILALDIRSAWSDLPRIRAELAAVLPQMQVIVDKPGMVARSEARLQVARAARDSVQREQAAHTQLRQARTDFNAMLLAVILGASCALIGILAFDNVRDRRQEIGILRAIGCSARQVLVLFLTKWLATALTGALAGAGAGLAVALCLAQRWPAPMPVPFFEAVQLGRTAWALGLVPLAALVGSSGPALMAARKDPAQALRGI